MVSPLWLQLREFWAIGAPLKKSVAHKNFPMRVAECNHPPDALRCRGNQVAKWWVCTRCGSRWNRPTEKDLENNTTETVKVSEVAPKVCRSPGSRISTIPTSPSKTPTTRCSSGDDGSPGQAANQLGRRRLRRALGPMRSSTGTSETSGFGALRMDYDQRRGPRHPPGRRLCRKPTS